LLRKWYGHDPTKWESFRQKYFAELHDRPELINRLQEILAREEKVTFVFAARDTEHNNALALKEFLEMGQVRDPGVVTGRPV